MSAEIRGFRRHRRAAHQGALGFHTKHLIRDIEVINLDGLSEAEALQAAGIWE